VRFTNASASQLFFGCYASSQITLRMLDVSDATQPMATGDWSRLPAGSAAPLSPDL
jgi:hypothetical protein